MDCEQCESITAVTEETLKTKENEMQDEAEVLQCKTVWTPCVLSTIGKEIYYFAGHEIKIWESLDSFGSIIWPAALALCRYLESNRETVDLKDKAVLEIGAGTGLVSIVASLLGAWVTATDLPEVLGNLTCNLSRNTRGHCRYTPQAAELFWGYELDKTFPHSVYRYDYILAADVVYQHDVLEELLVTMKHFCQPGTTLIWANKVRFQSDLVFTENFKRVFNTNLLEDNGEVTIFSATVKEERGEVMEEVVKVENETTDIKGAEDKRKESKKSLEMQCESNIVEIQKQKLLTNEVFVEEDVERKAELQEDTEDHETFKERFKDKQNCESMESGHEDAERNSESDSTETDKQQDYLRSWTPTIYYIPGKEIYHFLGQKIVIHESIDSFGATIWPAALALCRFLDTAEGQQQIHLRDKSVLELGAGTGLLSVVVTLLGAKLTATDLPEILSNLTCNLNRNTRGHRQHEPLVTELFWGHKLEETFPRSTHYYDYVLATDVVYHHDYLPELLLTMRHFCQPGTTLVWANKVRYARDRGFIEDFQKCFNSTLLTERDEVRIYVATSRETEDEREEESHTSDIWEDFQDQEHPDSRTRDSEKDSDDDDGVNPVVENSQSISEEKYEDREGSQEEEYSEPDKTRQTFWAPTVYYKPSKEIYYFLGHEIRIEESIDSYGGTIWPAALALCRFLDTPAGRQQIDLLYKSTLELGAGTGLVSIVATLLGAKLTATDLPEILGNLTCNLNRNTRSYRRHEPKVLALSWGHELEETFPRSAHRYDYVLAADVVYHHDFLPELLSTMRHFCQRGTTLIWANKIRFQSDLVFVENFQKAFNSTLLTEMDDVRIYSATARGCDER